MIVTIRCLTFGSQRQSWLGNLITWLQHKAPTPIPLTPNPTCSSFWSFCQHQVQQVIYDQTYHKFSNFWASSTTKLNHSQGLVHLFRLSRPWFNKTDIHGKQFFAIFVKASHNVFHKKLYFWKYNSPIACDIYVESSFFEKSIILVPTKSLKKRELELWAYPFNISDRIAIYWKGCKIIYEPIYCS